MFLKFWSMHYINKIKIENNVAHWDMYKGNNPRTRAHKALQSSKTASVDKYHTVIKTKPYRPQNGR